MPQIRITVRGLIPSIALLLAIVLVPQLLAGTLPEERAKAIVSEIHERRAVAEILERAKGAKPSEYRRIEKELENAHNVRFTSLRVRRAFMVPPFARRTAFIIEAHLAGEAQPEYFRVRGASVYSVSALWWHLRL